jgi:hypothetical protein
VEQVDDEALSAAAEAALRQAAAEGLTLERSSKNATGFKCVARVTGSSNMFAARAPGGGPKIDSFRTAEEAALCLARYLRDAAAGGVVHADVHAVAQASAAGALWQAEEEGLTLVTSEESASGFRDVIPNGSFTAGTPNGSFTASMGGKSTASGRMTTTKLGVFGTAEEAALCVARRRRDSPADAALADAAAEGLTLERTNNNTSGFLFVGIDGEGNYFARAPDVEQEGRRRTQGP